MNNNVMIFTFLFIFILIGFFSVQMNNAFTDSNLVEQNIDVLDEVGQVDITDINSVVFFSAVFYWVFDAPLLINLFLTIMRVVFWIIVYDKFRGI